MHKTALHRSFRAEPWKQAKKAGRQMKFICCIPLTIPSSAWRKRTDGSRHRDWRVPVIERPDALASGERILMQTVLSGKGGVPARAAAG